MEGDGKSGRSGSSRSSRMSSSIRSRGRPNPDIDGGRITRHTTLRDQLTGGTAGFMCS